MRADSKSACGERIHKTHSLVQSLGHEKTVLTTYEIREDENWNTQGVQTPSAVLLKKNLKNDYRNFYRFFGDL